METITFTPAIFDQFEVREGFLGWGYIGERRHLSEANRAAADKLILDNANRYGATADQLFEWANSKEGRYYADSWADGNRHGHAVKFLPLF